jgi:hypothetical protein
LKGHVKGERRGKWQKMKREGLRALYALEFYFFKQWESIKGMGSCMC